MIISSVIIPVFRVTYRTEHQRMSHWQSINRNNLEDAVLMLYKGTCQRVSLLISHWRQDSPPSAPVRSKLAFVPQSWAKGQGSSSSRQAGHSPELRAPSCTARAPGRARAPLAGKLLCWVCSPGSSSQPWLGVLQPCPEIPCKPWGLQGGGCWLFQVEQGGEKVKSSSQGVPRCAWEGPKPCTGESCHSLVLHSSFLTRIPAFSCSSETFPNIPRFSHLLLIKPGESLFRRRQEARVSGAGPTPETLSSSSPL